MKILEEMVHVPWAGETWPKERMDTSNFSSSHIFFFLGPLSPSSAYLLLLLPDKLKIGSF